MSPPSGLRRDGASPSTAASPQPPSAESSVRSAASTAYQPRGTAAGVFGGRLQTSPSRRMGGPSRAGSLPSVHRNYRQSNMRRSTSSRAGGDVAVDPFTPIKIIDEQGVNRTPKPLVSIVASAALRQARGLTMQDSIMLGSDTSEAVFGELSSATFNKGWGFDSGSLTPQEASTADLDWNAGPGSRMGRLSSAAIIMGGDQTPRRALHGSGSSKFGGEGASAFSPSSSQRPSRTPQDGRSSGGAAAGATDAAVADASGVSAVSMPLTEDDLAALHRVLLQETDTIVMLDQPGVVVGADTAEAGEVAAANSRYAATLVDCDAADKRTASFAQTLAPHMKHKEVQSGSSASAAVACQVTAYELHDSYVQLDGTQGEEAEEQLGSVLPSGAVVTTGSDGGSRYSSVSQTVSFARSSTSQLRHSTLSSVRDGSLAGGWGERRTTNMDSRPASARGSSLGGHASGVDAGSAAAVALLVSDAEQAPEAWTQLPGLADLLQVVEAAVSQNVFLPQLLQYRDVKPPPPLPLSLGESGALGMDGLSAVPSLAGAGSGQLGMVPPTPGGRPSVCSTPGSGRPTVEHFGSAAHTPHGATMSHSNTGLVSARPSVVGAIGSSMSGLGHGAHLLSHRPSMHHAPSLHVGGGGLAADYSRQSSLMSMGSSRVFRISRPPAGLQLLWTWTCSLTEGRPVTGLAWSTANANIVAAGYGPRTVAAAVAQQQQQQQAAASAAAATAAAAAAPGMLSAGAAANTAASAAASAAVPPQGAALLPAQDGAAADGTASADNKQAAAEAAGGRVALWSLKNQYHPVWTFTTKTGITSLDFSQRNPHMLAVGMHDGTIAVYDVHARLAVPLQASTAETGKHTDPAWKVRWVDPGPEREEQLVSISTDGRVKAWTVAKGLEHVTLTTLKRVPHRLTSAAGGGHRSGGGSGLAAAQAAAATAAAPAGVALPAGSGAKAAAAAAAVASKRDAQISLNTGGMSFDFSAVDRRMYLAGTEDGHIHKCSTSYSEQYLETYNGHIGPVYALQWSPFKPSLFLSCSGDCTIRMWQEGRQQQLMSFQSSNKEVLDVNWCPHNSTVFGAVTADGRLEVWDFAVSTLRPVTQHAVTKCAMTALLFAQDVPVVVAATDAGSLLVFRLVNLAADKWEAPEMQRTRLEEALRANITKGVPGM